MPLSFPLTLTDFQLKLRFAQAQPFRLQRFEEASGTGRGQVIVAEIAPPKWVADFTLARMTMAQSAEVAALMDAIGTINAVRLFDWLVPFPVGDMNGETLGSASVVLSAIGTDRASIRLAGLPGNYVIAAGTMISVGYSGGRRWLARAAETAQATSGGQTPLFSVAPHVPSGLTAGAAATLRRAFGFFRITSWSPGTHSGMFTTGARFTAEQVLA